MRKRYKISLYVVAWIGAFLTTNPNAKYWAFIWMFPLGLASFFKDSLGNVDGKWVLGFCIAIYVVHGFFYFRCRTMRSTLLWLGALVLLFAFNVPGCRAMINTH